MNQPSARPILLEVCIESVDDAFAAQRGGAGRLEINAALSLVGLTPSLGTFLEVKKVASVPVIAMLRPRPGGFAYSDGEFNIMRRDLDLLLTNGADGVAFGVLHDDGTIDEPRCRALRSQMGEVPAVFHRAFDLTPRPRETLEQLIALGFCRLLTSGQQATALQGVELLAELIRLAAGRIEILPGGGINRLTARELMARTGCDQIHGSLRRTASDTSTKTRPGILFGARSQPEGQNDITDQNAVAELCALLKEIVQRQE